MRFCPGSWIMFLVLSVFFQVFQPQSSDEHRENRLQVALLLPFFLPSTLSPGAFPYFSTASFFILF